MYKLHHKHPRSAKIRESIEDRTLAINLNDFHISRDGDDTMASITTDVVTESQGAEPERSDPDNSYEDGGNDNGEQRYFDLTTLRALESIDPEPVPSGRVPIISLQARQSTSRSNQSQTPPLSNEINSEVSFPLHPDFRQIITSQQPRNGGWRPGTDIGRTNSSQDAGNSTTQSLISQDPTNLISEPSLICTNNNEASIGETMKASEIELAHNSSSRDISEHVQERKNRSMQEMFSEMNPYIEQRERAFGREHGYCFFQAQSEQETESAAAAVRGNRVEPSRQQNLADRLWNDNGEYMPRYQNLADPEEYGTIRAARIANIGRLRRQYATLTELNPARLPTEY